MMNVLSVACAIPGSCRIWVAMMRQSFCLLLILAIAALATCATAQTRPLSPPDPAERISHVVIGPGDAVYEKFGHNALRIEDPDETGEYRDVAFNYGLFTFENDFIFQFIRGNMRYWMAPERSEPMLEGYHQDGREIRVQTLNLSPGQALYLKRYLWTNALPDNRFYLYNYYTDNCSTRLRDAIDHATGGQLRRQTETILTGHTYRDQTRRCMASSPLTYVALAYVLGQNADRELSRWEEMFLPDLMRQYLRDVRVVPSGASLIAEERLLYLGMRPPVRDEPPFWLPWFAVVGILIAASFLALDRLHSSSRLARIGLSLFLFGWFALGAFASTFLAVLNLWSVHWATYRNENLLHLSPAALMVLIALPWALSRKSEPRNVRMRRLVMIFSVAALALSLLGLLLKTTPIFFQQNWEIIALVLPVHAAVAMIVWKWPRKTP